MTYGEMRNKISIFVSLILAITSQELLAQPDPVKWQGPERVYVTADGAGSSQDQLRTIQRARMVNHFNFWVGAAFPVGDFSATTADKGGFAQTGFTLGLSYTVGITHAFGWETQVDFASNPLDESALKSSFGFFPRVNVSAGSWLTFWPMTGLKVMGNMSDDVAIFATAKFGMFIGKSPNINASDGINTLSQSSGNSTAFAYGFSGGLCIDRTFVISAHYHIASPEYSIEVGLTTQGSQTVKFEQSTSLLTIVAAVQI